MLVQGGTIPFSPVGGVEMAGSVNGLYTSVAPLTGIPTGTYTVTIKGPTHLERVFTGVVLNSGNNSQDFSAQILKAGDLVNDDVLDIFDYNAIIADFGPRMPVGGSPADFDRDNDVDIFDYNFLVGNFGDSGE